MPLGLDFLMMGMDVERDAGNAACGVKKQEWLAEGQSRSGSELNKTGR